ncbi:MAG: PAS domain-containing protein [Balneolaceae bacterium]|nr:PAS domain-containing protein [Balneolaceae bacterium]
MQKRIVDTLKQRNQDFTRIFNKASEFTYRLKINNGEPVFETVSEEFPVFTGISPEKVQQKGGYKEFIHPADVDKVKDHFKETLKGKSCTCTYRVKNAEDEYVEVVDYAKPEFETDNESITYICGAVSLAHKHKATV